MYFFLRLIIGILISCGLFVLLNKHSSFKIYIQYVSCFLFFIIFVSLLTFLPFENIFYTFSSSEKAFNYMDANDVELIVDGNNSELIVAKDGNVFKLHAFPKVSNGYKLCSNTKTKVVRQITVESIIITVYCYNYVDYYISIIDSKGGAITLSDEHATNFLNISQKNDVLDKNFITYYAYLNAKHNGELTINGDLVEIFGSN